MALDPAQILQALTAVKDPDLHRDIVALNFVKDLRICGNNVAFSIELTTPACPLMLIDHWMPAVTTSLVQDHP